MFPAWCDETDSVTRDFDTSGLDGKWPSEFLVAYARLVAFQVQWVLFYAYLGSYVGALGFQVGGSSLIFC